MLLHLLKLHSSLTFIASNCIGNTSESTVTSWRGLLERYLHRRDALRVVCHLVDARHGVTDVDREVSEICDFLCAPSTLFNTAATFRWPRSVSFAVLYVSYLF